MAMAPAQVHWNGDRVESAALVDAITHNCICVFGPLGVRLSTCAPHKMLVEDQRALDGLLFYRRIAPQLWVEEQTGLEGDPSGEGE